MLARRVAQRSDTIARIASREATGPRLTSMGAEQFAAAAAQVRQAFEWVQDGWCVGRAILGAELVNSTAHAGEASATHAAVVIAGQPGRGFHMATAVQVEGVRGLMVIDGLTGEAPVPVETWAAMIGRRMDEVQAGTVEDFMALFDTGVGAPKLRDRYAGGVKDTIARAALGTAPDTLLSTAPETAAVSEQLFGFEPAAATWAGADLVGPAPFDTTAVRQVREAAAALAAAA